MILKQRNVSLDFFRGAMALMVSMGHFFYWNNKPYFPFSFILAVDFFLVLSGFVIASSVLKRDTFDPLTFAKQRYLRLAPVYFFCVIISIPICMLWDKTPLPNLADIVKVFTLSQMLPFNDKSQFPMITLNPIGIAYTISAELWVGIILFPIIYFLKKHSEILLLPFLLIVVCSCLLKISIDSPDFMNLHYAMVNKFLYWGMLRCLMDYSIGIAAFIIISRSSSNRCFYRESALQVLCIVAFTYFFLKIDYGRQNEIFAPLLFSIFISSISKGYGIVAKITNNKIGKFMGDISYPYYLIHPIFIFIFINIFKYPVSNHIAVIVMISSIISAYFINKFIEKKSINYFMESK
ncbi:acyltransferase family protein [Ewingella americana]|uniref:Acyltransferase n=1 Tax=Ewingella americana TaxID=41202 RepID=A0A502GRN9_9GAMM|nr:acyltransferase [Ewingella americana]TPG64088.1 acyltransferase [Ewingella americana]